MLARLRQFAAVLGVSVLVAGTSGAVMSMPWAPFQQDFQRVAGGRWIDRAGQAMAESGCNPRAVSPVGARGIAQFMPGTWREWGRGADPFDAAAGIDAQHRYMLWLEARTRSFNAALGSYNAGLGSTRKAQVLADQVGLAAPDAWLQTLPRVTGAAHAAETRGYITNNARYREAIRRGAR